MKNIYRWLIVSLLVVPCIVNAGHEGYVVCKDSGDPVGDVCFNLWNDSAGEAARNDVARRILSVYGAGCKLYPIWPDGIWNFCVLDLGETFEVCKTDLGPCYRFTVFHSATVFHDNIERDFPSGPKVGKKHWVTLPPPLAPQVLSEWVGCYGNSPVFGITVNGAGTPDTEFFEIELQSGLGWTNIFDDYEACLPDLFTSNTVVRIRALNLDGESDWINHTVNASYNCGRGDTF